MGTENGIGLISGFPETDSRARLRKQLTHLNRILFSPLSLLPKAIGCDFGRRVYHVGDGFKFAVSNQYVSVPAGTPSGPL